MAEKKYVDFTGLQYYDEKIKGLIDSKDAAAFKAAKDYADGLADNYDAAGSAASAQAAAEATAKAYTDAEVAKANEAAAAAKTQADKGVADAATAQAAAEAADAKAVVAQTDVDNLETYVGTIPEGATATNVVAYVQEKTSGIATSENLAELTQRVADAEGEIDTLQSDMDAVEAKAATNEAAIAKLNGSATTEGSVAKQVADAVAGILDGAPEAYDTLNEIATWIAAHPDSVAAINADIKANADAIDALEALVGTLPEGEADVVSYIDKVVASEKARAEGIEGGLETRLAAVEAELGDGTGSVTEQIATAKAEAISAAASDAATKDEAVLAAAKQYTDNEIDNIDLSGIATNASAIITLQGRMDTAEGEIDDIQAALGATTDVTAAIADAKKAGTDAQADVDALEGTVTTLSGTVSTNSSSISSQGDRITALETKVGDGFVAITNAEIDGLFTA